MSNVRMGDRARDTISGFEGIVTSRHEYLNGCVRFVLTGGMNKETGEPKEWMFDEQQVEVVEEGAWQEPRSQVEPKAAVGGPRGHTPPRR